MAVGGGGPVLDYFGVGASRVAVYVEVHAAYEALDLVVLAGFHEVPALVEAAVLRPENYFGSFLVTAFGNIQHFARLHMHNNTGSLDRTPPLVNLLKPKQLSLLINIQQPRPKLRLHRKHLTRELGRPDPIIVFPLELHRPLNIVHMVGTFLALLYRHIYGVAAERIPGQEVHDLVEVLLFVYALHEPELRDVLLLVGGHGDYAGVVGVVLNGQGDLGGHCDYCVQGSLGECRLFWGVLA